MAQPKRIYSILIPFLIIAFLVSAIPVYWIGATGWVAFCVGFLITLAYTAWVVVTYLRRRGSVDAAA